MPEYQNLSCDEVIDTLTRKTLIAIERKVYQWLTHTLCAVYKLETLERLKWSLGYRQWATI
jgi:hypothetical protein